jgi:hypothetical protein
MDYFDDELGFDCLNCDNCLQMDLDITEDQMMNMDSSSIQRLISWARDRNDNALLDRIQDLADEGLVTWKPIS